MNIRYMPGRPQRSLELDLARLTTFLVNFLQDEVSRRKGFDKVVIALSGGIDSSVVTHLAVRAFGADNVYALLLPYATSASSSVEHAQHLADELGIHHEIIDITAAVDGYTQQVPSVNAHRKGNIMARMRMIVAFDKAFEYDALPLATGNKTERLFGYYTWHDVGDAMPVNPLGDLFKTQVYALAHFLGVPKAIIDKPASADLIPGQSDESDLGITYAKADTILLHHLAGYEDTFIVELGYSQAEIDLVKRKVAQTHWKRELSISAVISNTAINEFYLRPVDY